MRLILLFSRLALICNICYLVTVIARYFNIEQFPKFIVSTIVVLGFIAIFLNIMVSLLFIISLLFTKKRNPLIIGVINLMFLIFQFVNTFYLEL